MSAMSTASDLTKVIFARPTRSQKQVNGQCNVSWQYPVDSFDYTSASSDDGSSSQINSLSNENLKYDLYAVVPLYGQERHKSQIKPPSTATSARNGRSKTLLLTRSSVTVPGQNYLPDQVKKKKSYVDLHYAKIGYAHNGQQQKNREMQPLDSARATCGTETFRSTQSLPDEQEPEVFEDAQSCLSDSSSFYEKFIEDEKVLNSMRVDDLSNMKSISEATVSNRTLNLYSAKHTDTLKCVPVLSRLGPDTVSNREKYNNFKRQQSYGQKVSEKNRIKIMERKILSNLKTEMKESSSIDEMYRTLHNGLVVHKNIIY